MRTGLERGLHDRQSTTSRLLLVHPFDECSKVIARTAAEMGFAVRQVMSYEEALYALRHEGRYAVLVVGSSISTIGRLDVDGGLTTEMISQLSVGSSPSQIIVVTYRDIDMNTCCDLVQSGVGGFVDGRSGRLDGRLLQDRLADARTRYERDCRASSELHLTGPGDDNMLVWQSPVMADLLTRAQRAAQVSDVPILIFGESGTGKQLLAEYIHRLDPKRGGKRFLSVNCSAITGTLAESTIFGHIKGAYTGATGSRKGIFRTADGGTVLLDEIGEMDLSLQPKLLRVLQEGRVMPLGADDEAECDVRVIAATNRHLASLVEQGAFRLDLYQRLNVITLEIPPLRERREDIPALVNFFLKKYSSYYAKPIVKVDPQVHEALANSTLQGNVRELENTIRQALAFKTSGDCLAIGDIPATVSAAGSVPDVSRSTVIADLANAACKLIGDGSFTLPELVDTCEELVLRNTLASSTTTSAQLAKTLGLSRRTLYNKIQKYDLAEVSRESYSSPNTDDNCPRRN